MLKMIRIIIHHEIRDLIRDKATLKTMLTLLVFMPLLYSYILGDMGKHIKKQIDKDKRVGYIDTPEIHLVLPWLQQQGVIPIPIGKVDKETFSKEKLDAALSSKLKDEMDTADPIKTQYEVWTNGSNEKKQAVARFVQKQLMAYGSVLARQNLVMAGTAPQLLDPIGAEIKSLEPEPSSGVAQELLVALLGMVLFFSTLHVAVDTTAGERERQTLESLLYTAAPRSAVVLGKFIFVAIVAFCGMVWAGGLFWILGEVSIFQELLGRTGGFSLNQLLLGIAIMSPICFLVAAMQIMIGTLSGSVKQAQAYNSLSGMLGIPLTFLTLLEQIEGLHFAPIFGQGLAFRKMLQGEEWSMSAFASAQAATLALALVMLVFVIRRFESEKIVLNKY